jgi:hypothetical protein
MTSPTFRPAFAAGEFVFDLGDDGARSIVLTWKNLAFLGSNVADADADIAVSSPCRA